jgi:hypothetical protein
VSIIIPTFTGIIYVHSGNPLVQQIAFGSMVGACILEKLRRMLLVRKMTTNKKPLRHNTWFSAEVSVSSLVSAFVLWNIDNYFCSTLCHVRKNYLDPSLGFLTQFHAWWHLLTLITSIYAVRSIEEYYEDSELADTGDIKKEEVDENAALFPMKR